MMEVGVGRWKEDDMKDEIEESERKEWGKVEKKYGIYMVGVD